MSISNVRDWAKGKKTYLLAGVAALGSFVAYLTGDISLTEFLMGLLGSGLTGSLRAGLNNAVDPRIEDLQAQISALKAVKK